MNNMNRSNSIEKISIPAAIFEHIITFGVKSLFTTACDGTQYIQLSTIVKILTEGGYMSHDDKKHLEKSIKQLVEQLSAADNRPLKKIIVEVPCFKNRQKKIKLMEAIAYGREDIQLISGLVTLYIEQEPKLVITYP